LVERYSKVTRERIREALSRMALPEENSDRANGKSALSRANLGTVMVTPESSGRLSFPVADD